MNTFFIRPNGYFSYKSSHPETEYEYPRNISLHLNSEKLSKNSSVSKLVYIILQRDKNIFCHSQTVSSSHFYLPYEDLSLDYKSKAQVLEVSPSQLPPNVLGMYDGTTHTIYINNSLSELDKQDVRAHESGHGLGIHNERATDIHAASRTGRHMIPFRA